MNAKGQSLLEGTVGLLILMICCQGLIWLFVLIENSMVIHHILYEALLCTQLEPPRSDCVRSAREQIQRQALGSQCLQVDLVTEAQEVHGTVQIRPPWGRVWTLKDSLALPLRAAP